MLQIAFFNMLIHYLNQCPEVKYRIVFWIELKSNTLFLMYPNDKYIEIISISKLFYWKSLTSS